MKLLSSFLTSSPNKSIVRLFFQFLQNPTPHASGNFSVKQKIVEVLILIVATYGLVLLTGLLNEVFIRMDFYEEVHHYVIGQLEPVFAKGVWSESDWELVLFTIVAAVWIAPFLEEIAFRLFLRYRLRYLLASLGLQFLLFLNLLNIPKNHSLLMVAAGLLIALIGTVGMLLIRQPEYQAQLAHWWRRHFSFIYYYSAIAFGLIHYIAYGLQGNALWFAPIILSPIILMGLMLGFVRVRYGMWYAIAAHSGINGIAITTMLFTL